MESFTILLFELIHPATIGKIARRSRVEWIAHIRGIPWCCCCRCCNCEWTCLHKTTDETKSKQTKWQRRISKYPECNQCYTLSTGIDINLQPATINWMVFTNWFYAMCFNRSTGFNIPKAGNRDSCLSCCRCRCLNAMAHSLCISSLETFGQSLSIKSIQKGVTLSQWSFFL